MPHRTATVVYALLLISLSPLGMSCASVIRVAEHDDSLRSDVDTVIQTFSPTFTNETEKRIVFDQTYGFFSCVKQIEGTQRWGAFMSSFAKSKSITRSFLTAFGKSFYELAGEVNTRLENDMPATSGSRLVTKTVGDFEVSYVEGTNGERDYPQIEYLLRLYDEKLKEHLLSDARARERYGQNISHLDGQRIGVFLITDETMVRQLFGKVRGAAATLLDQTRDESGRLTMRMRMLFKYHELFTAYTIAHELTHVAWALGSIDPQYLRPMSIEEVKQNASAIMASLKGLTHPGALMEGVAEYEGSRVNLMFKYGLLEDIDTQLRDTCIEKKISIDAAALWRDFYGMPKSFPAYETAHSLFKYIADTFGERKALELSFSEQTDGDFRRLLGVTRSDVGRKWTAHIMSGHD